MFPLRDQLPTRSFPIVNYVLIVLNILMFLLELTVGLENEEFFLEYALIPNNIANGVSIADAFDFLTSMFMHAGLAHIAGNMLYLWIFGDNVEDALGHVRYLFFYLAGGVVAAITHIVFDPNSTIPTVGASGAIAAALGAYLILYPQSKVQTIVPVGRAASVALVPAVIVLGLWFVLQLFQGIASLGVDEEVGGVAVWAHIGGFVFGLALAKLLAKPRSQYGGTNFDEGVRRPRLA